MAVVPKYSRMDAEGNRAPEAFPPWLGASPTPRGHVVVCHQGRQGEGIQDFLLWFGGRMGRDRGQGFPLQRKDSLLLLAGSGGQGRGPERETKTRTALSSACSHSALLSTK